jgi:5-methyltetrahydrofolate--homocysteine methyltransferase
MKGSYPQILQDDKLKVEANKLFNDAQVYLTEMIECGHLTNIAKVGFFPANSVGDDIEVYHNQKIHTLCMLRSQRKMDDAKSKNRCLSDYIAPKETNIDDYIGAFVVTTGLGLEKLITKYKNENDDYAIIMIKALADRLAEAFAEYMHMLVRTELWGFAPFEKLSNTELIQEKYQGIRPAPGYAACPDHSEKLKLFDLLKAEDIGVNLTENFAMTPASSVSGWYFAHSEAKYFNVGNVLKDQVEDYAKRKNIDIKMAEKYLRANLNY